MNYRVRQQFRDLEQISYRHRNVAHTRFFGWFENRGTNLDVLYIPQVLLTSGARSHLLYAWELEYNAIIEDLP